MDLSESQELERLARERTQERGVADILRAARALIATEDTWCAGELQIGARLCVEGAYRVALGVTFDHSKALASGWIFLCKAAHEIGPNLRPCDVNDRFGHAVTLRMVDRAIALSAQGL